MILCASVGCSVQQDSIAQLAEFGFTHICCRGAGPNREFERTVKKAHEVGIRVVAIFPNWMDLGLCSGDFCFKTADGFTNEHFDGSQGRIEGCSHWHPGAEERWFPTLQPLVDLGIDGILASPMHSDRMYPTDWYPWENRIKYSNYFWCHDKYAKAAWAEISNEPMPDQALIGHDEQPLCSMEFYRWYQSGWINRINRLADAALDANLKDIFTWWIPLDFWDGENMADGTASSVAPLEAWRQHIIGRGGLPVTVSACIWGLWPRWEVPGLETLRQVSTDLHWATIGGAEAWGPNWHNNLLNHAKDAKARHMSGLFAFVSSILDPANAELAKTTMGEVRKVLEE